MKSSYFVPARSYFFCKTGGGILLLAAFLTLLSCSDQRTRLITWTEFQPVYMTEQEFAEAVSLEEPRPLQEPGKIYLYEGYLLVNEINEGIHIYDNSDPAAPVSVGFIRIPANKDMAIRNDILYADSHSDLLVFDIADMEQAQLLQRVPGVFAESANDYPGYPYQPPDPAKGIVVDWKKVEREKVCDNDCNPYPVYWEWGALDSGSRSFNAAGPATGRAGSTARFALTGDYLYAVDDHFLHTFDVTAPQPRIENKQSLGWAIETIFPYRDHLFIGSRNAMYIFGLDNPRIPDKRSTYDHFTACDPVVVEDDYAFITLRNSGVCNQAVNRLEVVDISNLMNPILAGTYPMANPHGLGIDRGQLFITEGNQGLVIMDASDPLDITLVQRISSIHATDVIPYQDVLIVTGKEGITQYDYSDIQNLQLLSVIPASGEDS